MARSINEMTLQEHRILSGYVDAIARLDARVQRGVLDAECVRQSLRAAFDARLRAASSSQLTRQEAFVAALRQL